MFFVLYFKNNLTYTLNELIYGCLWSSLLYLRKKKNAEKETEMNASWFFSVSGKIKNFIPPKKWHANLQLRRPEVVAALVMGKNITIWVESDFLLLWIIQIDCWLLEKWKEDQDYATSHHFPLVLLMMWMKNAFCVKKGKI